MYKLIINGGIALNGHVKTAGSKNSSLPILFASILANNPIILTNTPHLSDVSTTLRLLMDMGAEFILESDNSLFVDGSKLTNLVAQYNLVKTMRASILALGPMLAKYGKAKISLPGGCAIGSRPVNLHLKALEDLGASIKVESGYIYATAKKLIGAEIHGLEILAGPRTVGTVIEHAVLDDVLNLARVANVVEWVGAQDH